MADIQSTLRYDADLGSAMAKIKTLTGQINTLNLAFNSLDASAQKTKMSMANAFSANVGSMGAYTSKIVQMKSAAESFGEAIQKNRLTMSQYFREAAVGLVKQDSLLKQYARQQVRYQQSIAMSMGTGPNGKPMAMVLTPKALDMANAATRMKILNQEFNTFRTLVSQGATELINFGKNTQWTGRQLTVGLTMPVVLFGAAFAKTFMNIDKELTRFAKVYGQDLVANNAAATEKMKQQVMDLARTISSTMGVAASETAALAADIAATGKTGPELLDTVAQTTRLAVLGEVDRQEAMKATLAIQTAFKQNTTELADSINFLNAIENQTSTTLSDLVEAIPKAGPVIKGLGGSIKDLSVLMVAMKEGGIPAAEAANAIKSGMASLINPTKKASETAKQFGVDIEGIVKANKGQLMPTIFALQNALSGLDDFSKSKIIEEIFGKYQFARISALFNNLGRAGSQTQEAMKLAGASTTELASVASRELKTYTESTTVRFQRMVETIKNQLIPIGQALLDGLMPILNAASGIIDTVGKFFEKIPDQGKGFLKFVGAIALLAGPALMLIGLFKQLIGNGVKAAMSIVTLGARLAGIKVGPLQHLDAEAAAAQAQVQNLTTSFVSQSEAIGMLNTEMQLYLQGLRSVAGTNPQMFTPPIGGRLPNRTTVRRANGGDIPGGYGGGDRVPALLESGEFIVTKEAASKYRPILDAMNRGILKGFADGDIVGDTPDINSEITQKDFAHVGNKIIISVQQAVDDIASGILVVGESMRTKLQVLAQTFPDQMINLYGGFGLQLSKEANLGLGRASGTTAGVLLRDMQGIPQQERYAKSAGLANLNITDSNVNAAFTALDEQIMTNLNGISSDTRMLDSDFTRIVENAVETLLASDKMPEAQKKVLVQMVELENELSEIRVNVNQTAVRAAGLGDSITKRGTKNYVELPGYTESGQLRLGAERLKGTSAERNPTTREYMRGLRQEANNRLDIASPSREALIDGQQAGGAVADGLLIGIQKGLVETIKKKQDAISKMASAETKKAALSAQLSALPQGVQQDPTDPSKYIYLKDRSMQNGVSVNTYDAMDAAKAKEVIAKRQAIEQQILNVENEKLALDREIKTLTQQEKDLISQKVKREKEILDSQTNISQDVDRIEGLTEQQRQQAEQSARRPQTATSGVGGGGRSSNPVYLGMPSMPERSSGLQDGMDRAKAPSGSRLNTAMNASFMASMAIATLSSVGVVSEDVSSKLGLFSTALMGATMAAQMFSGKNVMGNFLGLGGAGARMGATAGATAARGAGGVMAAARGGQIGGAALLGGSRLLGALGGPPGIIATVAITAGIFAWQAYQAAAEEARQKTISAFVDPIKSAEYFGQKIMSISEIFDKMKVSTVDTTTEIDQGLRDAVKQDYGRLIDVLKESSSTFGANELSVAFSSMVASGMSAESAKESIKAIAIEAGQSGGQAYAEAMAQGMLDADLSLRDAIQNIVGEFKPGANQTLVNQQKSKIQQMAGGVPVENLYKNARGVYQGITYENGTKNIQGKIFSPEQSEQIDSLIQQLNDLEKMSPLKVVPSIEALMKAYSTNPVAVSNNVQTILDSIDTMTSSEREAAIDPLLKIFLEQGIPDTVTDQLWDADAATQKIVYEMTAMNIPLMDAINNSGLFDSAMAQALINTKKNADIATNALNRTTKSLSNFIGGPLQKELNLGQKAYNDLLDQKQGIIDRSNIHIGVIKQEAAEEQRASEKTIAGLQSQSEGIQQLISDRQEQSQEVIDGLEKEKSQITKTTDKYLKSIQDRSRADTFYANQRKSNIGALGKLASGDIFGFLQDREAMAQESKSFSYDNQIKAIEERRDSELESIDEVITKKKEQTDKFVKEQQKQIDAIGEQITSEQKLMDNRQAFHDREIRLYEKATKRRGEEKDKQIKKQQTINTQMQGFIDTAESGQIVSFESITRAFGEELGKQYKDFVETKIKQQYVVDFNNAKNKKDEEDAGNKLLNQYKSLIPQVDTIQNTTSLDSLLTYLGITKLESRFPAASGGYISGPGGPTEDKIPAMLSNGEYVIKASSVNKYGSGMLNAINMGHFAGGGYVKDMRATMFGMGGMAKSMPRYAVGGSVYSPSGGGSINSPVYNININANGIQDPEYFANKVVNIINKRQSRTDHIRSVLS